MSRSSTVLIVDDYADALDVWTLYLTGEGFHVLTAADGREALARARGERPDIVILDLELPDVSGCDVARALRAAPDTRHIPLIAATGSTEARHLDEARGAGFDLVLSKPCDPDDLVLEIRRLTSGAMSA
jgi:CheY-like chemotaxis protein